MRPMVGNRSGIVTLTTDFGTSDWYVGALRGAVLKRCPESRLVDISHGIAPQDICGAALVLRMACPEFPEGTVHLVVVDPGVGTQRNGVVVSAGGHFFVGPDNGVLVPAVDALGVESIQRIDNPDLCAERISSTFHGRDVFGPVAGFLAGGGAVGSVGPSLSTLVPCPPEPAVQVKGDAIVGQVVAIDRFGNLITNIDRIDAPAATVRVQAGGHVVHGLAETYGESGSKDLIALFGSSGRLELALPNGSAAEELLAAVGLPVVVQGGCS